MANVDMQDVFLLLVHDKNYEFLMSEIQKYELNHVLTYEWDRPKLVSNIFSLNTIKNFDADEMGTVYFTAEFCDSAEKIANFILASMFVIVCLCKIWDGDAEVVSRIANLTWVVGIIKPIGSGGNEISVSWRQSNDFSMFDSTKLDTSKFANLKLAAWSVKTGKKVTNPLNQMTKKDVLSVLEK